MTAKPMWKEGLFLTPQHMQLMDDYHERMLDERVGTLSRFRWGVSELEIDPEELARGVFRLSRCVAVMPDGTLVQIGRQLPLATLAVTISGETRAGRGVDVYLCVPTAALGGASTDGQARGARYASYLEHHSDVFREAADAEIECVRPNVQLLFGHDSRQNYETIKLAELIPGEGGRLKVSDGYVPPLLKARASTTVMDRLGRLVAAMGAKQKDLVARYGGRASAMVEFGAADMATFWYLHTINSMVPVFMHYASGDVHPETLYLALASFAGQLATFESTTDPLDAPRFDHADLSGTLLPLFERVFHLLGTVVSSRYTTIRLEQPQPGLFVGRPDDPNLLKRCVLYVVAGGDVPEDTLRDDVPRYIKVGSVDQIAQIVQSALPGVTVRIDLSPPSAVPVRSHMVYLRLDKAGRYWDAIVQSNGVAIYQPVKPERVQLELIAVEGAP